MSDIEKVLDYLKKANMYYLLTTDGDRPRGRPFASHEIIDGKLYIATGSHKKVYQQMLANPKVEILAMGKGEFMRIDAVAVPEEDEAVAQGYLERNPHIAKIYNKEYEKRVRLFYLDHAAAEILDAMGNVKETLEF